MCCDEKKPTDENDRCNHAKASENLVSVESHVTVTGGPHHLEQKIR